MQDKDKTKEQILNELQELWEQFANLKKSETYYKQRAEENCKKNKIIEPIKKKHLSKQMSEQLQGSEEKYRALVNSAQDIIYIHDLKGDLLMWNPQGNKLTGYSNEEGVNMNISGILTPESLKIAREKTLLKIRYKKHTPPYELSLKCKDGTIVPVEVTSAPIILDGKVAAIQGIARDIRDRIVMEDRLRQAHKMEALGQLAGGISHDFNNILQAILGYTDIALMKIKEDNTLYQNLSEIRKASVRATNLTHQLLMFSRRQPVEMVCLDISKVIYNVSKMLECLIGENITLIVDTCKDLWKIKGDLGSMEQVITNIVVNARDAIPNKGKIIIKTENVIIDEEYCKIYEYARPGKFVFLSIKDTGVGMNDSIVDHIFEPFFTTKAPGKGTGMGLSAVYGIIKQHKGWINVESSPKKGSIFKIYLQEM
jgi:PAS domain S-box-containing protein